MENNVQWGVPTQRTKKVEKFNTPVITMNSLAKKGAGRKFQFNKAAVEALGLEAGESYITFGFQGDKILVLASADEQSPASLKITKSYSISNKKTYEYIAKSKTLDTNYENYLHLVKVDGQPYLEVSMIKIDGNTYPSEAEATEEVVETENTKEEEVVAEAVTEDNW
jgi:hypothetical protein